MSDHRPSLDDLVMTRRELLCRSGTGMGALALGALMTDAGLLGPAARAADGAAPGAIPGSPNIGVNPLIAKLPPLRARA
jgi:hypothetical protein